MPQFEPDRGKNDDPATPDEYKLVREGKGSAEQIERVRKALRDKESPLYRHLGDSAIWARLQIERKYATPGPRSDAVTPVAQRNFFLMIEYLRDKREAGVLTEEEVISIIESTRVAHLDDPTPTASQYAMSVTRLMKALIKLHPELAGEAKAVPISPKR